MFLFQPHWKLGRPLSLMLTAVLIFQMAMAGACHAADYFSPTELIVDGDTLYVVASTSPQVIALDTSSREVKHRFKLDRDPTGLALSSDKATLFVTSGSEEGALQYINLQKGTVEAQVTLGHTPMAPVLTHDGKRLFVCNRFNNEVVLIDLESKQILSHIPVQREPVAALLSRDGRTLFVANHLPAGAATKKHISSTIDLIDTESLAVTDSIALPNGSINLRSFALTPDGKYLLVPSVLARYQVPTTQLARGWINTHALHIIDTESRAVSWTVLLDEMSLGAANPWGVSISADGLTVGVSHAATHELSLIDWAGLLQKLQSIPDIRENDLGGYHNSANQLGFLSGLRKRIKLPGLGPRSVKATGKQFAVAQYFSGSVALVSFDQAQPEIASIALGPQPEMDFERTGHLYFEDASLCFQQWQSCATCHPDVRADTLNWDLLNDGIGNPKNTKSLLLAHETPPSMVTGIRDSAEVAVRAGIRHIQFSTPDEKKASAIDAFLRSLQPIPSPHLEDGELSEQAVIGKQLYEEAKCSKCHSGPYFTNQETRDVGTAQGVDEGVDFDVPSLIEVWRTAPYLHDGRAATMHDVITTHNQNDDHGRTSHLSAEEIYALEQYILSL